MSELKRILIADDSRTARQFIIRCLQIAGLREGVEFLEAANGQEALAMLKDSNIDLIITDLTMPTMDGRELLRRVRAHPRFSFLPVAVVSSATNDAVAIELKEMGAFMIIAKPITPPAAMQLITAFAQQPNL